MSAQWFRVRLTLCKNGYVVSTVFVGEQYETAIWNKTSEIDVVKVYRLHIEAVHGHAAIVESFGGRSLIDLVA